MDDTSTSRIPFGLDRIFYGWWIVCACFIINLYTGAVIFFGYTAFFDPLVREFNWSYAQISFAMSLRGIEMSVLSPVAGFLVDRYGARTLALWGVIMIGVGFLLLSITHSLWMFYAGIILISFGGGGCTVVVLTRVIINWFKRHMGLALGIVTSGFGASGLLIPVIVWLIDDFGWRAAVVIIGIGMWVIGIPLVFIIRDSPEECGLSPDGRNAEPPLLAKTEATRGDAEEVGFRDALRQKSFLLLALSEGIRMMAVTAVITHIMPYLNLLQVPRATAGLIAAGTTVISIGGRFGFGLLADHFEKRHVLAISLGLMSIGIFALCYVDVGWIMILFLVLFPTGFGGAVTVRGTVIREYFGREAFGRLTGLIMGAASVGGVIGPTLVGFLVDITGSYYSSWMTFGIASCCAVILILRIGPAKKRE
jgi:MFS transporter, OFA family, oxalate/formate antiporter